jgi:hypothetical protein
MKKKDGTVINRYICIIKLPKNMRTKSIRDLLPKMLNIPGQDE